MWRPVFEGFCSEGLPRLRHALVGGAVTAGCPRWTELLWISGGQWPVFFPLAHLTWAMESRLEYSWSFIQLELEFLCQPPRCWRQRPAAWGWGISAGRHVKVRDLNNPTQSVLKRAWEMTDSASTWRKGDRCLRWRQVAFELRRWATSYLTRLCRSWEPTKEATSLWWLNLTPVGQIA